MKTRTVLSLWVAVCLLGGLVYLVGRPSVSRSGLAAAGGRVIGLVPHRIMGVTLRTEGYEAVLRRERAVWHLVRPVRARADGARIEYLLDVLQELPCQQVITPEERAVRRLALADYGLEKPAVEITLYDAGRERVVGVGALSAFGDSLYVRLRGSDSVVATSTNLLAALPARLEELRDRRILHGDVAHVSRFELRGPGGVMQFARANGQWQLRRPAVLRADATCVAKVLKELYGLRAARFMPPLSAPTLGLVGEETVHQVGIWAGDDEIGVRLFVSAGPDEGGRRLHYVRTRGLESIYAVTNDLSTLFRLRVNDVRDRAVYPVTVSPDTVVRLRVEREDVTMELAREQGEWRMTEPAHCVADVEAVDALLGALVSLEAVELVDVAATNPAAFGLAAPASVVRLWYGAEARRDSVQAADPLHIGLCTPDGAGYFAQTGGAGPIFRIDAEPVAVILGDVLQFRDRTVLALEAAAVRSIRLSRGGEVQSVERDRKGEWSVVVPDAGRPLTHVIGRLLTAVGRLDAVRFQAAGDIAEGAALTLTFGLTGTEAIQKTLVIGKATGSGGYYAAVRGQDVVFVLDAGLPELLSGGLVGSGKLDGR